LSFTNKSVSSCRRSWTKRKQIFRLSIKDTKNFPQSRNKS